jgi:DHA2 family multidrug resistance protein
MHERIGEAVTPFNDALQFPDVASILNTGTDTGRAMLDAIVTRQAAVIAYANDFKLLMILCILCMPLVFAIGSSRQALGGGTQKPAHAGMD